MSIAHLAKRVVTCDPIRASEANVLGVVEDGAVLLEGERVVWVGPRAELPPGVSVVDHGDVVLTPGLVDAHTHACWAGSRHAEYAVRMAGGSYEAIAKAGGGIVSTHRAVAQATRESLANDLRRRLVRMATLGVTTVEVKSGYGLDYDAERKQLEAIHDASRDPRLPRIVPTYLALHALPPSARADREAYVRHVAEVRVPEVAKEGLAGFLDAYIDQGAFQVAEARRVFEAGIKHGMRVRAHVGQFADVGGAELAAELGAWSVDHVEHVSAEGATRLAKAKTHAVLLPTASFTLAQTPPPVQLLREAGVSLVVASDANPGTAPTESLPLAMAFAVRAYGLTPEEALLGATRNAAASLGAGADESTMPRGVLAPGSAADLVVWDLPHEIAIVQPWGVSRTRLVLRGGLALHEAP